MLARDPGAVTRAAWVVAGAVGLALAGCGAPGTGESTAAADCANQVRVEGVVYTSHGYTDAPGTKLGTADWAECWDVGSPGREPLGSVFPEDPRQVTTWSFEGYSSDQVLGVRNGNNPPFAVFVADSVPRAERERIFRELSPADE
jgi:hypothetical protein